MGPLGALGGVLRKRDSAPGLLFVLVLVESRVAFDDAVVELPPCKVSQVE